MIFGRDKNATALITSIRSSSRRLSQHFSDFEEVRGNGKPLNVSQGILTNILIEINNFDVIGLEKVLAMSPTIDPTLKAYLPQAISKIGRYYGIAYELINAASSPDYTIFRRISVQPIEQPHFDMAFMADHSVNFDQAAKRVTGSSLQDLLGVYGSQSISAARKKFASRTSDCPTPWKIHAEIQLLLFYEQQPHIPHPRFIGSSKSACYLCDLFIEHHGEFCVPRTHGRLYDRWILPEHAANGPLSSIIDRFNAALEATITTTLRNTIRSLPHPNESVLLLQQPWSSNSTLAEPHELAATQEVAGPAHDSPLKDQPKSPSNTLPRSSSTPTTSTSQDQPILQTCVDNVQPDIHPTEPTEITRRLLLGDSMSHKLHTPQDVLNIEAGPARLHLSWDVNTLNRTTEHSNPPRACWVQVQLCSAGEIPAAFDDESVESVDVDSLAEDCDTMVEGGAALSEKNLALRIRGYMVVVKYTFDDCWQSVSM